MPGARHARYRRTRLRRDDGGWIWLEPEQRASALRFVGVSVVVSILLVAAAAAATLPPPVVAVPLLAAILASTGIVVARVWRRSHERVAVSGLGVVVQSGARVTQLGWPAIREVRGVPARRGVRILVGTDSEQHVTAAAFEQRPAREWLARCTAEARGRRLEPETAEDGLGFRSAR